MSAGTQYTIDELARTADTTVRSVRVYHERGLLPPPEVRGRIGYYGHEHLNRLKTIHRLLSRGVKLNGIRELLAAWDRGEGLADVLGVADESATPSYAPSLPDPPDENARHTLERIGSPRVRDLAVRLVHAGMPLPDTIDTLKKLRADCDRIANDYADIFATLTASENPRASHHAAHAITDLITESLYHPAAPPHE